MDSLQEKKKRVKMWHRLEDLEYSDKTYQTEQSHRRCIHCIFVTDPKTPSQHINCTCTDNNDVKPYPWISHRSPGTLSSNPNNQLNNENQHEKHLENEEDN
mmetsp:Transcript_161810/g.295386  ORF Transcript_161810/g.295386 Transcript_161810/m.295386 type:complete len:101 (+) Transcript_161810:581-883(+)